MAFGCLAGGCLCVVAGVTTPQVGRLVSRWRLFPLWREATSPYPNVRRSRSKPGLYRTIIEIQDATAEARSRNELSSPLFRALSELPARSATELDVTVRDLEALRMRLPLLVSTKPSRAFRSP